MLGDQCSHGVAWGDECPECNLISARELVAHWGDVVDEARRVIAEAGRERMEELKKTEFEL